MKVLVLVALLFAVALADVAPLLHADGLEVIDGSFIVVLKEEYNILHRDIHITKVNDLIVSAQDGSEVSGAFNIGTLNGYFGKFSPQLLEFLRGMEDVKYVEADQVMSINYKVEDPDAVVTQNGATWGISRISQRNLPLGTDYIYNSLAGSGVDVYIIDTGIYAAHTEFGARATAAFNAITAETSVDLNGHGTHVAGTIGGEKYGIAKLAYLYGVKVLGQNGSGSTTGVISGINWVTNSRNKSRKSVANMSLGGGTSTTLDAAVTNSIADGVAYAIAAGNDNSNACNYSPARVAPAITVGATTNTDARATYSNIGTCVTLFGPGSSITSAWIGGTTATNTISGTSMATPHFAGTLAIHRSVDSALTPAGLKSWIVAQATPAKVTNPGTGSPTGLLYSPAQ